MASPVINQYLSIKNQYKDYLLFFRLGDFYELFYDDAKIAAKVLNITLTKKIQKDEDIPMSGIPFHTCDHYIAKLVQNGYKIAICEQTDTIDPENKIINREVVRIITNGTVTDDILLEPKRNNYLLAITGDMMTLSTAIFDLSTNEFIVEDIPKTYLKLFLEKTDAQEILLSQNWISNFSDYNLYKDKITIIQETSVFHIDNKIKEFFNLHSTESLNSFSIDNKQTILTIIEYLVHTQKQKLKIHFPTKKAKEEEVILDKFTRRNLEITKTLQNQTKGSLIWLLDETKTSQGARFLFKLLNNPINSIEKLNERYNKIDYFINKKNILEDLQNKLNEIPDFERLLSKIILKRTNPFELRQLSIGIINIINISKILEKEIPNHSVLALEILKAIKEDTSPNNYKDTDYINHGYNQELTELKDFNKNIESEINKLEEEYKNYTKITNLRIKNTPLGFLIETNNSNIPKLDYKFSLKQSLKTTSRFSTEKLNEINEKFNKCTLLIKEKENEIFLDFLNKIEEISEDVYYYSSFSSNIDTFSNLAILSLKYNYIRPIITNDNSFEIKNGVHPILQKVFEQKGNNLVENDCNLNNQPIMFLTGPNMAGKSTYLRQQAIICLMAHCGMFVPASYAKIGLVDQIFSRISTNDNLLEGNSTFMMEMIELSLTITQANNKSFLILDEIGRGTSAQEGKALAQAILEYLLNNLKCRALFSSHYLEIAQINHDYLDKKMMQINNNSENNQIHFTYKIINGVSKKSYALEVAKMTGMPLEIIQTAEKLLNS